MTDRFRLLPAAFLLIAFFFSGYRRPPSPTGTIAYIRNGTEIRLIGAEGTNDRLLWTHPDATPELGLYGLAWRPDGKELAFSSAHASASSLYHADLYAIQPDGTGFRKITNAPDRSSFARFPKGKVTLTVRNNQYSFQQAQSSAGVFLVYIAGAELPQQVTVAPGKSVTVVFPSVADFGKKAQAIVAVWGNFRWFMPGTDVVANSNTKAPDLVISGDGVEYFGAFHPVWRADGSELSYRNGVCLVSRIPAHPPEGELYYRPMFNGKNPLGTCTWDWGPTPSLADQVIYTENAGEESSIFLMKEGGAHPGRKLTAFSNLPYQLLHDLHWMPDGSGLLYSTVNLFRDASNIYRYDLATGQTTQVTHLEGAFARSFSISPDGQWIAYERSAEYEGDRNVSIWIQSINGSGARLLVKNGMRPAWK